MIKKPTIKMEKVLPSWFTQVALIVLTGLILDQVTSMREKLDRALVSDARQTVKILAIEKRLDALEPYHRVPFPGRPKQKTSSPDLYHKLDQRKVRTKDKPI